MTSGTTGEAVASIRRPTFKLRVGFAALTGLATATLYAEGVLKNGWFELVLLAPVLYFLGTSRPSERLQGLLLALTAVCLTISGLDLLLRPLLGPRLDYTPLNISARKLPRLPIVGRWDAHLDLEDDLYGDLAAIAGDPSLREPRRIRFRTDDAGFRNDKVPDRIDLLILGDSFSAGGGTTQDRIFAQLLADHYGFRTYNLAFPGGPYDQYINFAIEWARLSFAPHPRMVWTLYTGNDLEDAGGEVWDLEALPWRSSVGQWLVKVRTYRKRSPLRRWMDNLRIRWAGTGTEILIRTLPDGQRLLFAGYEQARADRSRSEVERHPNFMKLERTFAAARKLAADRNVEIWVLLLPTKGEVYRWIIEQRPSRPDDELSSGFALAVLGACERAGLRCLDTKPYLVREARRLFEASGQLLWWRDDSHIGECGHEALARLIAEHVRDGRRDGSIAPPSQTSCKWR